MRAPAQQQEQKLPSAPRGIVTIILDAASLDSLLRLPHKFIVEGTDTLVLDSARILQREKEYRLDARNGTMALDSLLAAALAADTSRTRHALVVVYRYLPFQFQDAYARRQMVVLKDTAAGDTKGHGVNGVWFVINPTGIVTLAPTTTVPTTTPPTTVPATTSSGGGYY